MDIKKESKEKDFKTFRVNVLPELPPKGIKVDIGTMVGVPGEKRNQINLYTWHNDEWIFTDIINKFELGDLKDAYDAMSNAINKLIKVSANIESDELIYAENAESDELFYTESYELFSKLSKITTKIQQAKYELADDVLEQLERS
jgi:hypothetical protein